MIKKLCLSVVAISCVLVHFVVRFSGKKRPPHIIFIVADDLGWNDVGWHNPKMHTPNLDKLATNGVILDSSYVLPVCSPTRSCFMTGKFPIHTGMQSSVVRNAQPEFLPEEFTTLPEKLKALGYSTHIVGKWHLGYCNWKYTPTFRGFDSFFGYYGGFQGYYNHTAGNRFDFRFNTTVFHPPKTKYSAELFADRAIDIINRVDPESQSLYLYIAFQSVHGPLEIVNPPVPKSHLEVFSKYQVPEQYKNLYPYETSSDRKTYCGMVSALDEAVGNIHEALTDRGFMENALIVFTTDNGGNTLKGGSNYPLLGGKSTLWEGGTRGVAFAYSQTLLQKTGYINKEMMHAVDWFPTLLSLAGGTQDSTLDGINQWDTVTVGAKSSRYEFVYNIDDVYNRSAIRVGKNKLILEKSGSKFRLFDLEKDPFEHADIAEQHRDIERELKDRLDIYRQTQVPPNRGHTFKAAVRNNLNSENLTPGWC